MSWTNEEIEEALGYIQTKDCNNEAWIILINGERFVTAKGKSVWKQKNHASSAFTNEMTGAACEIVRRKLIASGESLNIWRNPKYQSAVSDLKKALVERGIMEYVKITD